MKTRKPKSFSDIKGKILVVAWAQDDTYDKIRIVIAGQQMYVPKVWLIDNCEIVEVKTP